MRPQFLQHSRLPGPRPDAFQWRRSGEKEAGNFSATPTTAAIQSTTSTAAIYATTATTSAVFTPTTVTAGVTSALVQ